VLFVVDLSVGAGGEVARFGRGLEDFGTARSFRMASACFWMSARSIGSF